MFLSIVYRPPFFSLFYVLESTPNLIFFYKYGLHHDVEVSAEFKQPRDRTFEDSVNPVPTEQRGATYLYHSYRKCTKTNFDWMVHLFTT